MKIYISGNIGGIVISDTVRRKFARAEAMLKAKGHDVFNPCDEKWQEQLRRDYEREKLSPGSLLLQGKFPTFYTYCLLRDQMVISAKDAVYMMHDWKRSPGATAEYYFALAAEKEMSPLYVVTAVNNLTGEREAVSKPHSRWKTEELLVKASRDQRRHRKQACYSLYRMEPYCGKESVLQFSSE